MYYIVAYYQNNRDIFKERLRYFSILSKDNIKLLLVCLMYNIFNGKFLQLLHLVFIFIQVSTTCNFRYNKSQLEKTIY